MTKRILFILLALVLAISISLIGCTQEGQQEEEEEEEPEVLEIVLSDHNPPFAAPNPAIVAYGAYIEEHSGGRITVDVHTGGELYSDVELFGAVKSGAVDGGNYVPEIGDGIYYFQVLNLPFMGFTSQEMVDDIYADLRDDHPEIQEDFTSQGLFLSNVVTMPGYNLHFYEAGLVVDDPGDLYGMSICAMEGNLITILEYIPGVTGIQIAFPDLHPSFTAGQGDGFAQHNPFQVAVAGLDYFFSHTEANIIYTAIGILWNKDSYDACVDAVGQSVMDAAAQVYGDIFYPLDAETMNAYYDAVEARGDTLTELDATQTAAFAAYMTPWIDDWIAGADDPATAQALYDDCKALIAAY
jgi:TRAP-type C4-dicarboxylate transport system substrate-binding protein